MVHFSFAWFWLIKRVFPFFQDTIFFFFLFLVTILLAMSSYHKIKLCENQSSHISISVDFIRLETWPMAIRL